QGANEAQELRKGAAVAPRAQRGLLEEDPPRRAGPAFQGLELQVDARPEHDDRSAVAVVPGMEDELGVAGDVEALDDVRVVVDLGDQLAAVVEAAVAEEKPLAAQA